MAQDTKQNAGFSLPEPAAPAAVTESAASAPTTSAGLETVPPGSVDVTVHENTSSRDLLVGGGILLALFIAFFFAKNAYANGLVGKRLPPNKANASGWWLFIFLASLATGVVLTAVNASVFMAPLVIGPIALVALAALVLTFTSSRN